MQASRVARWIVIACLPPLAWPLAADERGEVESLLERMSEAVQTLDYQGVFVYLQNNQLESMEIVRRQGTAGARERLVSLNGSPREVVREGGILTCFLPGSEALLIDKRSSASPFPELHSFRLDSLSQHYNFRLLGEDRVAGRKARVVAIIPRDAYRYGYRIYVDADSSLPLKSDLMDEKGNPVEQTMFTSLKVGPDIPPIDLRPSTIPPAKPNLKQIWDASDSPQRWAFSRLPAGFALNYHERYSEPDTGDEIDHFVVSDGLASLSVFVEKAIPDEGLRGGSRMGAVSAWGEQVDGHQVTVVGEVPMLTLREVLNGLRQAHAVGASGD